MGTPLPPNVDWPVKCKVEIGAHINLFLDYICNMWAVKRVDDVYLQKQFPEGLEMEGKRRPLQLQWIRACAWTPACNGERRKHHEDFRKSLRNFQLTFYLFNTERYIKFNVSNKLLKNRNEGDGILQSPESGADHPCCHVAHHLMVPSILCDTLLSSTPTIVSFQATDRYTGQI